jgi:negative regulator of sigma E activity
MANQIEEQISLMLDDELSPADRDQLIKQLKHSDIHKQILSRYGVIQEAMKKNLSANPKHDLFARVTSALESEPVLFAPSNDAIPNQTIESDNDTVAPSKEAAVKPFSVPSFGWAAAAAVAMVAIVSSVNLSGTQGPEMGGAMDLASKQGTQELVVPVMSSPAQNPQPVLVTNTPLPMVQVPQVMPSDDQWERIDQTDGIAWEAYIKEHSETASQGGVQPGVAPFARIVSFEGDGQQQ